MTDTGAL